MSAQTSAQASASRRPQVLRSRAGAVVLAVGSAVLAWLVETKLAHVNLAVRSSPGHPLQHIGLATVIGTSLLFSLLGWAGAGLAERLSRRPQRTWLITGLVVLVISLAGPLTAAQGAAAKVSLACMHLVVAGWLIPWFALTAPSSAPGRRQG